jgi:hypothetical protein
MSDDKSVVEEENKVEQPNIDTLSIRGLLPDDISVELREKAIEMDRMLQVERQLPTDQLRVSDPERFAKFVGGASVWNFVEWLGKRDDECPEWGTKDRAEYLNELWRTEDMLAGVVFTQQSRVAVMGWTITGPVDGLKDVWRVFGEAETSHSWDSLIRPVFQDYLCTDEGGIIQIAYDGKNLPHLYYLPSRRCWVGPVEYQQNIYDLLYLDVDGHWRGFSQDQFWRFCSMPDTDPLYRTMGFCFLSRAQKSAARAKKLAAYKDEKLANLPAEGIAAITGLTKTQVENAMKLYKEERKRNDSLTFPGVLWLVANTFGQQVEVDFISFRDVWEGFNDMEEAEIYMKTLALDAGVDVGEFWMIDVTGATRAAAERQHRKALGKGPAEFLVGFERWANQLLRMRGGEYFFQFDVVDDEQDLMVEQVRKARIDNIRNLWLPDPVSMTGLISTEQAQEMLVEEKVVPKRFFESEIGMVTDIQRQQRDVPIGTIDRYGHITVYRQFYAAA